MRTLLVKVVRRLFAYTGVTVIGRETLEETVLRLSRGMSRPALTGQAWSQMLQLRGQLSEALKKPASRSETPVMAARAQPSAAAAAAPTQDPDSDLAKKLDAVGGRLLARSTQAPELADRMRALAQFYAASATLVSLYPSHVGEGSILSNDEGTVEDAMRAGVWVPGNEVELSAQPVVVPWRHLFDDPDAGVFLVMGQSNAANHGDRRHTAGNQVFAFDFFRTQATVASDPLPGASGNGGSAWTRLGDRLINAGVFKRVLFIPIAYGGTYVADWAPNGSMNRRTAMALARLRRGLGSRAVNVSAVLWQQGEAEANHTQMMAAEYRGVFQEIVADLRAKGVFAPVLVACSTQCGAGEKTHDNADEIRKALLAMDDPASGLLRGPDTDVIGPEHRYDRCHFAESGLERCADLWFDAIRANRSLLERL